MAFDPPTAWRPQHPPAASIYVRRRLAALGLEGLLLAVRTLSVTRLRFRLSGPSLDPKSELFFSLSLLDFSVAFPKLPEDEKTGRQNHLAENRISKILFHLPVQLQKSIPMYMAVPIFASRGSPCTEKAATHSTLVGEPPAPPPPRLAPRVTPLCERLSPSRQKLPSQLPSQLLRQTNDPIASDGEASPG